MLIRLFSFPSIHFSYVLLLTNRMTFTTFTINQNHHYNHHTAFHSSQQLFLQLSKFHSHPALHFLPNHSTSPPPASTNNNKQQPRLINNNLALMFATAAATDFYNNQPILLLLLLSNYYFAWNFNCPLVKLEGKTSLFWFLSNHSFHDMRATQRWFILSWTNFMTIDQVKVYICKLVKFRHHHQHNIFYVQLFDTTHYQRKDCITWDSSCLFVGHTGDRWFNMY